MADELSAAYVSAREAWPDIVVDETEFRQSLASAGAPVDALCVTDLYLARACAARQPRALTAFDERYLAKVPAILARHRARDAADEVRQLVRERLLLGEPPRIAAYTGRGSLAAWLRITVLRTASNFVRGEKPRVPVEEADVAQALGDSPELRVLEARYRGAFREAFRDAFAALAPAERAVLKLHFLDGVSVRKLAPLLGVSPATAGRRLLDAQDQLGQLVLAQLGKRVEAKPDELASVVRALLSRLDISISTLLVHADP
jgi:RNA polymerase sigma-70 factor (ECF subfamily)